jgi:hypothetical protein
MTNHLLIQMEVEKKNCVILIKVIAKDDKSIKLVKQEIAFKLLSIFDIWRFKKLLNKNTWGKCMKTSLGCKHNKHGHKGGQ